MKAAVGLFLAFVIAGCSFAAHDKEQLWPSLSETDLANFSSRIKPPQGNPESHYLLARYYQDRHMHKAAIGQLEKSIQIDPQHWRAYNALGFSHSEMNNLSQAQHCFNTAVKLNPDSHSALNNLGYFYLLKGDAVMAEPLLKKAISFRPENTTIANNLELARTMQTIAGDPEKSMKTARERMEAQASKSSGAEYAKAQSNAEPKSAFAVNMSRKKGEGAIEISNGNGIRGMAKKMGTYLKRRGYRIARYTNAGSFNYSKARIYYLSSHENLAMQVASEFPEIEVIKGIKRLDRKNLKVKVIIGKDLAQYRQKFREDSI